MKTAGLLKSREKCLSSRCAAHGAPQDGGFVQCCPSFCLFQSSSITVKKVSYSLYMCTCLLSKDDSESEIYESNNFLAVQCVN